MKTEAFRFKLGPVMGKLTDFSNMHLAPGDQVVYSANILKGITKGELELFTLTTNLGYITLVDKGEHEIIAMQHHLVNSMEEVAEDFVDVVAKKADEAMRKVIEHECDLEEWEIDHMLIHFKEMVRHTVWEKMDKPEPVRRKKWWQKRLTLS